jgi:hypothetical protein
VLARSVYPEAAELERYLIRLQPVAHDVYSVGHRTHFWLCGTSDNDLQVGSPNQGREKSDDPDRHGTYRRKHDPAIFWREGDRH